MASSREDATEDFRPHLVGDPRATAELSRCLYGELRHQVTWLEQAGGEGADPRAWLNRELGRGAGD